MMLAESMVCRLADVSSYPLTSKFPPATDVVYSDLDPEHIFDAIPDTAFHRNVELLVLAAAPKVKTHIISPPTIYGIADHALVQKGISKPTSVQIPGLIRAGIARRQAGVIGKGLNVWANAHTTEGVP
jgi:hypothetical protein